MGLENSEFREAAHKLIDIVIDYHETLKNGRPPIPDVKPGKLVSPVIKLFIIKV